MKASWGGFQKEALSSSVSPQKVGPSSNLLITQLMAPCITREVEKAYSTLGVQWNALTQAWESDIPEFSCGLSTVRQHGLDQVIELASLRFLMQTVGCSEDHVP